MKMTVNEAMVFQKALRGRLGELSSLRTTCASRESYYGDNHKVVEPMYDVKELDRKCVSLENALLDMDTRIKQSNAITIIEVDVDRAALLAPLS